MIKIKQFDCVQMKHEGAKEVQKKISRLSRQEELEFWRQSSMHLKGRKEKLARKRN